MKTICFYFQIHQPFRLKRYRFFNIGRDHYYYDDFANEDILQQIATRSYLAANKVLSDLILEYKDKFKIAFSLSGVAMDQLEIYAPEVIDGLRELAKTGNVEFLTETYGHSLAALYDPEEFREQIKYHAERIEMLFGQKPTVVRNTELIYSDEIAEMVYDMGYRKMITEGAKHILGWKSPNYVYQAISQPNLKLLLRNSRFSDDITYRFSDYSWNEYPLTAEKFISWIAATPKEEKVINLFMNYETLGNLHPAHTGIFEFMRALPRFAFESGINFATPSEILDVQKPVAAISVPNVISWADEERDVGSWLGNKLQKGALQSLYEVGERVRLCTDRRLKQDWLYLQTSDHFYYMSTKHFGSGSNRFSPYMSPYDAFNNYMNVLSDFIGRVKAQYPDTVDNEELNALLTTIHNQEMEIKRLQTELKKVIGSNEEKLVEKSEKSEKPVTKRKTKK